MQNTKDLYKKCELCARKCRIDRTSGELGFCRMSDTPVISRAALHFGEEPIISGTNGSGAVFFSGCSLGCIYCQNKEISRCGVGKAVSVQRLVEIFFELQELGAHNINLVTPTHFVPSIAAAIKLAKLEGLTIPFVYNTGSFDTSCTLKLLEGLVDIYLPDLKYYKPETARELSLAADYPRAAREAIAEMVRQRGEPRLEMGMMTSGVIVRILLLPGHLAEAKLNLAYLYNTYGDSIYISLMNQYTPSPYLPKPLDRTVTHREYDELVDYALRLGIKNAFIQEWGTQKESFIPPFDLTGV